MHLLLLRSVNRGVSPDSIGSHVATALAHHHGGARRVDKLRGLIREEVTNLYIRPLVPRLIHKGTETHKPLEKEVFREELLEHVFVYLLLIKSLSWGISMQVVRL